MNREESFSDVTPVSPAHTVMGIISMIASNMPITTDIYVLDFSFVTIAPPDLSNYCNF
jgi:hypothetical protein